MSEAKKPAAMVEIHPGSPEWQTWLVYHRGTKTETRMLLCLGGKTKTGDIIPPRSWLARSKFPPDAPKPENAPRKIKQPIWAPPAVHASAPEGSIDLIVERMTVIETRHAKEADIKKRQRKEAKRTEDVLDAALKSVAANHVPYINGVENLGTLKVADPLEEQEIIRAGRGHFTTKKKNAPLRERVVSLRNDPIGRMAKRGHLGRDEDRDIRLQVARHWQRFYERAEIGGAKGIDPTRDHVDGGGFQTPDTDGRLDAEQMLARLAKVLGLEGENLLRRVLGENMELKEIAAMFGFTSARDVNYYGRRLVECLDTLAGELGYKVEAKGRRPLRDEHAIMARAGDNPELHRAIHRARRGT
jgi:DNA polymerase III delta prime subunit